MTNISVHRGYTFVDRSFAFASPVASKSSFSSSSFRLTALLLNVPRARIGTQAHPTREYSYARSFLHSCPPLVHSVVPARRVSAEEKLLRLPFAGECDGPGCSIGERSNGKTTANEPARRMSASAETTTSMIDRGIKAGATVATTVGISSERETGRGL